MFKVGFNNCILDLKLIEHVINCFFDTFLRISYWLSFLMLWWLLCKIVWTCCCQQRLLVWILFFNMVQHRSYNTSYCCFRCFHLFKNSSKCRKIPLFWLIIHTKFKQSLFLWFNFEIWGRSLQIHTWSRSWIWFACKLSGTLLAFLLCGLLSCFLYSCSFC